MARLLFLVAAAFVLAGCADRKELERARTDLDALQMEVRRLQGELQQARDNAAAARTALAEREERERALATRFTDMENRTRNLEQFNEAVFGRMRAETTQAVQQATQESRVRLDQIEFRFSRQLEDVQGQVATVLSATSDRERDIAELREQVRRVLDQENQPPRLVRSVPPEYPRNLRRERVEGSVEMVFLVDMAGNVVEPRVTESPHPDFSAAAIRAVEQWRFNPALVNGRPSNAYVTQTISFRLAD
jgi:TonB family protein